MNDLNMLLSCFTEKMPIYEAVLPVRTVLRTLVSICLTDLCAALSTLKIGASHESQEMLRSSERLSFPSV